jgi:dTDP-4-amino-4,6-dideoxygalactose transaminase
MRLARSHGMSSLTWDRHRGHSLSDDVTRLGYNYRIDEMRAALGLVQLARLPEANFQRRELTRRYREQLRNVPGITLPFASLVEASACHLFPLVLPPGTDRVAFMAALAAQGIQNQYSLPPYPSILLLPALVACRLRPQSPPNRGSRAQAGDPAAFSNHDRGAAG